jgi:hypothetical protein
MVPRESECPAKLKFPSRRHMKIIPYLLPTVLLGMAAPAASADPVGRCICTGLAGNFPGVVLFLDQSTADTPATPVELRRFPFDTGDDGSGSDIQKAFDACHQARDYDATIGFCIPTPDSN